jgi:inhibitor of KinA
MNLSWTPLGEGAILVSCDDDDSAVRLAAAARRQNWPWLVDVVAAYRGVALFFDDSVACPGSEGLCRHHAVADAAGALDLAAVPLRGRRHEIPVCYERQLDLARVADVAGLSIDAVIEAHLSIPYRVRAIGFCPGFPYLGYLPDSIANVPRLPSPRVKLPAGSVGLTGRQTGIYTESRPGGWNIVGETPLTLVDVAAGYFPLAVGDLVQFIRIDETEFRQRMGERLKEEG